MTCRELHRGDRHVAPRPRTMLLEFLRKKKDIPQLLFRRTDPGTYLLRADTNWGRVAMSAFARRLGHFFDSSLAFLTMNPIDEMRLNRRIAEARAAATPLAGQSSNDVRACRSRRCRNFTGAISRSSTVQIRSASSTSSSTFIPPWGAVSVTSQRIR